MDDEFKLCWKNFQDNIASGFQNLYDRGDLVDVTLACDGKLLHAHKIVLAICSPYFQEIFSTNPCKHPIIILKDVTFNIMCELLEFMYQGVVNVKHTELQSFMKIGQLLQIKGLATNASSSAGSSSSDKSASQLHHTASDDAANTGCGDTLSNNGGSTKNNNNASVSGESNNVDSLTNNGTKLANLASVKSHSPASSPSPMAFAGGLNQPAFKSSPDSSNVQPVHHSFHSGGSASGSGSSLKRHADLNSDALSVYSHKHFRRSLPSLEHGGDHSDSAEGTGLDSVNAEDYFLSSIPHIASNTSAAAAAAAATLRSTFNPAAFGFDYNLYKNSNAGAGLGAGSSGAGSGGGGGGGNSGGGAEYPNELHMPNDYSKGFANHMDIPPIAPGEHWFHGKLEFMLSQRGKPLLVHDGHTFGIQYVRKDKKYWQCNLSRKFNCKARVTTTDTGEIIVTNNEHCHTEIRQHLRKDYQRNKVMMNALINLSTKNLAENLRRHSSGSLNTLMGGILNSSHSSTVATNAATAAPLTAGSSTRSLSPQTDNTSEHNSSLDFTKAAAMAALVQSQSQSMSPQQHGDDDDDGDDAKPLDCGLRATKGPEQMCKDHGAAEQGGSSSSWKCKSEMPDTK